MTKQLKFAASFSAVVASLVMAGVVLADIDLGSITPEDQTVAPSASVTYTVTGDTSPPNPGVDNDWKSTRVTIDPEGLNITACVNNPNHSIGAGVGLTASVTLTAPAVDGVYTVVGKGFRSADCVNERDSESTTLTVVTPPPPTDYCDTVDGIQDEEFDCPEPTDYCDTVDGVQDEEFDCPPPTDYCDTVDGVQDEEFDCPEPTDYCDTVDGVQAEDFDCPPLGGEVVCEGALVVDSIETVDGSGIANNSYASGWSFLFHITVPTCETHLAMKFADWTGAGTLPAGGNMRISSAQADNAGATVDVVAADTYTTPTLNMTSDLSASAGVQVDVLVEVKMPIGTPNGSYSTSYGVQSN